MNSPTRLRAEYHQYIDESPNFPDHIKPQAKDIVSKNFAAMSASLGAIELLWRRETQKDNEHN